MKNHNLFVNDVREREETVAFAGLGLAGIVMVVFAVSSMAHFAAGLDDLGTRKATRAPTAGVEYIRATTVSNAPIAATRLRRSGQTSSPSSCPLIF